MDEALAFLDTITLSDTQAMIADQILKEIRARIYSTPIREEPIWVARRMRWLSPPDRVPACRVRVRY